MAIITGIATGLFSYFESKNLLEKQFKRALIESSKIIHSSIIEKIESAQTLIIKESKKSIFQSDDYNKIQERIEILVESRNLFHNIYFFDSAGILKAAAYADEREMNKYLGVSYETYKNEPGRNNIYENLKKAFESGKPVFSDAFLSNTKKVMYSYIVPVISNNKVVSLFSCGIQLTNDKQTIVKLLDSLKPHKNSFVSLTTDKGLVLVNSGQLPSDSPTSPIQPRSALKCFIKSFFVFSDITIILSAFSTVSFVPFIQCSTFAGI